jgi:NAD(P)-dependent dehydrogenase (short-subunit alcohol dehydrogenase family)
VRNECYFPQYGITSPPVQGKLFLLPGLIRGLLVKICLVTGCSSGLGKALAFLLANKGAYRVYASVRNSLCISALETEAKRVLGEKCEHCVFLQLDVCDEASVNTAVSLVLQREGRIDVLVNNAGYSLFGCVETISMEECKRQFETNFFGVVRMIQAVGPSMRKQKSGTIVNVGSIGGIWGQPMNDIYCASKFALEGLTECMAPVYEKFGVDVCILEPGAIASPFLQNAKKSSQELGDWKPIYDQVEAFYTERISHTTATGTQTPEEVAQILYEKAIAIPKPSVRIQCNPATQPLVEMKLNDVDGSQMKLISTKRILQ